MLSDDVCLRCAAKPNVCVCWAIWQDSPSVVLYGSGAAVQQPPNTLLEGVLRESQRREALAWCECWTLLRSLGSLHVVALLRLELTRSRVLPAAEWRAGFCLLCAQEDTAYVLIIFLVEH